jgi:hypothetical protein
MEEESGITRAADRPRHGRAAAAILAGLERWPVTRRALEPRRLSFAEAYRRASDNNPTARTSTPPLKIGWK